MAELSTHNCLTSAYFIIASLRLVTPHVGVAVENKSTNVDGSADSHLLFTDE